ncbi:MAG: SMP-30/gluconolactonase/LRE family protein, partial [Phycisphaerae bacterium]
MKKRTTWQSAGPIDGRLIRLLVVMSFLAIAERTLVAQWIEDHDSIRAFSPNINEFACQSNVAGDGPCGRDSDREFVGEDCDANGIIDSIENIDCNSNGIHDPCETRTPIFVDEFNDGAIDAAWTVELIDAGSAIFGEPAGALTVTDIVPTTPDDTTPAIVRFARDLPQELSFFTADVRLSWDGMGMVEAMDYVEVRFIADTPEVGFSFPVVTFRYVDGSFANAGDVGVAGAFTTLDPITADQVPLTGSADFRVERRPGSAYFLLDDMVLGTETFLDTRDRRVDRIEIEFGFYNEPGSLFSSLSVDYLRIFERIPGTPDCNFNGIPDDCDGPDTDGDSVPDVCDQCPAGDDTIDEENNGIPDACETIAPLTTAILDATGDGMGNTLSAPFAMTTDAQGNMYVAGYASNNVLKRAPDGTITQIVDSTGNGVLGISLVNDLAADSQGNVYVATNPFPPSRPGILKVAPGGETTLVYQSPNVYPSSSMSAIEIDEQDCVYFADAFADLVFKLETDGTLTTLLTDAGDGTNSLIFTDQLAVDSSGNVFASGNGTSRVFKITPEGAISTVIDATGDGQAALARTSGLAVAKDGTLYVTGYTNDNVFRVEPDGSIAVILTTDGDGQGNVVDGPRFLAVDEGENVYVTCAISKNIFRISPDGQVRFLIDNFDSVQLVLDQSTDFRGSLIAGNFFETVVRIDPRIYVDAGITDGSMNQGTSWSDAFPHLQDALNAAVTQAGMVNQFWIAQGTYMPDGARVPFGESFIAGTGDRDATFDLQSGIAYYGGFEGTETSLEQRNPDSFVTTLSGDLSNNDTGTLDDPSNDENSYHIVTMDPGAAGLAVVDGFSIRGGEALIAEDSGAGILHDSGSLAVLNCRLFDNDSALFGGAIASATGDDLRIRDCEFTNNRSNSGGALHLAAGSEITNTIFSQNIANTSGGAVFLTGAVPDVVDCEFYGNSALFGGAVDFRDSSARTLQISSSLFSGNVATEAGGAIHVVGNAMPPDPRLSISNSTFFGNDATNQLGGGIRSESETPGSVVHNSIFWGNTDGLNSAGAQLSFFTGFAGEDIQFSLIQDFTFAGTDGNLDVDPLFLDADGPDDVAGTIDDDLRLGTGSPAIDAGSNSLVVDDFGDVDGDGVTLEPLPLDLLGQPRFFDDLLSPNTGEGDSPVVDMGVYEFSDCNQNGMPDAMDVALGGSPDCNGNDYPDECEIDAASMAPGGPFYCLKNCATDCDGNGVPDTCDFDACDPVVDPSCDDCNLNDVLDGCDISTATSADVDSNGIPDECLEPLVVQGNWSEDIWDLVDENPDNPYPDSGVGVPDLHVVLESTDVLLDVDASIETLTLAGGSTLDATQVGADGDLVLEQPGGIEVRDSGSTITIGSGRTVSEASMAGARVRVRENGAMRLDDNATLTVTGPLEIRSGGSLQAIDPDAVNTSVIEVGRVELLRGEFGDAASTLALADNMSLTVTGPVEIDGRSDTTPCPTPIAAAQGGFGAIAGGKIPPVFRLPENATVIIEGPVDIFGTTELDVGLENPMLLLGDFNNQCDCPNLFDWTKGALRLDANTAQRFEVGGRDVGDSVAGYVDNFAFKRIEVGPNSVTTFEDTFDNDGTGFGDCTEA